MTQNPHTQYGASETGSQQSGIATPPQQVTGGQQSQPQQVGGQQQSPPVQQPGMRVGMRLEEALTQDVQIALQDFNEAVKVCEWCADQCIDEGPQMAQCIRLCRDTASIATLNIQLFSRDSIFGLQAAELFVSAAEACAQECAQHQHSHCQACAEVLNQAVNSTRQLLTQVGGGGTGGPQGVPQTGGQF